MSDFMGKEWVSMVRGRRRGPQRPSDIGATSSSLPRIPHRGSRQLPTEDLPWAHVMNPITSATVSGLGQSPLGAVEGTWVVGFFQDGADAQQPIIIGTLPGVPQTSLIPHPRKAFKTLSTVHTLSTKRPMSTAWR